MAEKSPPTHVNVWPTVNYAAKKTSLLVVVLFFSSVIAILALHFSTGFTIPAYYQTPAVSSDTQEILGRCRSLRVSPGPPTGFEKREASDRYEHGTNATWIRNCRIITGEKNGSVIIHGDLFLDKGIVKAVGKVPWHLPDNTPNVTIIEADGAWITPGLVDIHSHIGVLPSPTLNGAIDFDSKNGPILPWLRTIDGFHTHDDAFELAISGGVTTVQVLPGSSNAIGGEAFMMKLRKTVDRSASSMLLEPPHSLKGIPSDDLSETVRWRYMKLACGENLKHYGNRMDAMWALRSAFNQARMVKKQQDAYCAKAEAGLWGSITTRFPESQEWDLLVDVLRGRVKISVHCYEAVDLDAMVRLSNEFEFPIGSFHHAAEAYLVPNVLKRTWEGTPAVALFATRHRYKREAFRGSEFAPRILADEGIPVVMKSDHPFLNSRYLMYEAQQAHYFGLSHQRAIASVTSVPATAVGLWHRIGALFEGADADVVMWDSHPLQLGATPKKVWIDGVLQIPVPSKTGESNEVEVGKGKEGEDWQRVPRVPNWDKEREETIKWEGLPPLQGRRENTVIFQNVAKVLRRGSDGMIKEAFSATADAYGQQTLGTVIVEDGQITCMSQNCANVAANEREMVDLRGGSISPGIMTFGSPLGLEEIESEPSTGDGEPYDAFRTNIPTILDDVGGVLRAMDALVFGTRNALLAYRSGVTYATSSLIKRSYIGNRGPHIISGLSTTFRTKSAHAMERGAIIQDVAALHVVVGRPNPLLQSSRISVSTQMAALRRLLYGWEGQDKETGDWFRKAAEGIVPLVLEVHNADIMAALIILKAEVEEKIGSRMRMVFSGATEAHLLAREIRDADVGVILQPARAYPAVWDQRRILPGPPLTNDTALVILLQHGVTVGLGVQDAYDARNTKFTVEWAMLESNGRVSEPDAVSLVTSNLERLLGIRGVDEDLVAYEGGSMFDQASKAVGVISRDQMGVDLF
ncbi:hypothetical protein AX15_007211 [Amanita polypyramis BW_CC]|nr:hypothetical protein AX15_007211 [Amanita polypyramis BW_CC]